MIREKNPTLKNLLLISKALQCPLEFFVLPMNKAKDYLSNVDDKNRIEELEKENLVLQKIIVEQVKKSQTN